MANSSKNAWATEMYKKMLIGVSVATVALTFLLGITKWLVVLIAAVLALLPALKWKNPTARLVVRIYEVAVVAIVPALLLLLLCIALKNPEYPFQTEYLVIVPGVLQMVLPAAAFLAIRDEKFDIWFMRILGALYAVFGVVFVFLVPPAKDAVVSWLDTLLMIATSLVMLVLPLLVHPIELPRHKKVSDSSHQPTDK